MQPRRMKEILATLLPDHILLSRRLEEEGRVYIEFTSRDVEMLHRLGIEADKLGPRLVVCMWDETSPLEVGGFLVVDNVAMGLPAMGGIRLAPDISPLAIHNLARGMTMKNAAADLPFGGAKSGIVASANLSAFEHKEIVCGFARLLRRYRSLYNPGPDVGTDDQDMKTVAIENGLDNVLSKPAEMGGNRIDELGAAAGGVVIALQALHKEAAKLRVLPQFHDLIIPPWKGLTCIIQGFGAVGANVARILAEEESRGGGPKVIGISDASGYLFDEKGLDVGLLLALKGMNRLVTKPYFLARPELLDIQSDLKFSSARDDLLRESAFCLIPAAPQPNYLGLDTESHPAMTTDKMGRWAIIIEGANTYSPDPKRKAARRRLEREVYQSQGVLIATDFLVNSGGVIFAAHERLIPTPEALRIPDEMLGNRAAVDRWLADHAGEMAALAERRRAAAEDKRDTVIRENMRQLVNGLIADEDALPCQVAERISINRIVRSESSRVASEVMKEMATVQLGCTVQDAAQVLVREKKDILSVQAPDGQVRGIITDWDITQAAACGQLAGVRVEEIMTRQVVSCRPDDSLLDVVLALEQHAISALPVLWPDGKLGGVITADMLATTTLYHLLLGEQH